MLAIQILKLIWTMLTEEWLSILWNIFIFPILNFTPAELFVIVVYDNCKITA